MKFNFKDVYIKITSNKEDYIQISKCDIRNKEEK